MFFNVPFLTSFQSYFGIIIYLSNQTITFVNLQYAAFVDLPIQNVLTY